ncbi:MAG TPA: universal stress protein [Dehalococcoidia bacterium]|nr:universal stress protein [Dehalococcoidia bacterium]
MFETIVVPLDGSELSEEALPLANEVAAKFGSRILLVRVVDSVAMLVAQTPALLDAPAAAAANVELIEEVAKAERDEATTYLAAVQAKLAGRFTEAIIVEGGAAEEIGRVAAERGAGLVVMCTHGRGGLGRLLYGSVADAVLRHGATPVLLARPKRS